MTFNYNTIKCLSKLFKNISSIKSTPKLTRVVLPYSTIVLKPLPNIFDLLTDILLINRSNHFVHLEPTTVVPCVQQKVEPHKIDKLISGIDMSNMQQSVKILINELLTNIKLKDWNAVDKLLKFFIDKKVCLSAQVTLKLADEFCSAGFVSGLKSLLCLTNVIDEEHMVRGELLYYLARCNWIIGNVQNSLAALRICYEEYPELMGKVKKLLRIMIFQSVSNRSEAVKVNVANFIKEFTQRNGDYYPITILWNDLFTSEWYFDNQYADTLLSEHEHLRVSVAMITPALVRNFIKIRKLTFVYRLMESLLKHKMIQPYTVVTQMLYDYYCNKGEKSRCAEIVKSSKILKAPLREDQYNSFISWSVSGNPYKFTESKEKRTR